MSETSSSDQMTICPACGEKTLRDANFCEFCGSELSATEPAPQAASQNRATEETLVIRPDDVKKLQAGWAGIQGHTVAYRSDIGHKHHVNQDSGGAWSGARSDGTPVSLIVVADGVSAGRHSEEASKLVVEVIRDRFYPLLKKDDQTVDALVETLLKVSRAANHQVSQRPHLSVSSADATTLVAAFAIGGQGAGVWCGDSRVYHFSASQVTRLTRDHSWAEGVVSHGIMSAEDAAKDPRAHMITRWLGPPEKEDPGVEAFQYTLEPGDVVLCCTDGLYMYFGPPISEEAEMAQVLQTHATDLQRGIDRLVDVALERGGRDNVTAAAISAHLQSDGSADATTEIPSLQRVSTVETVRLPDRSPDS